MVILQLICLLLNKGETSALIGLNKINLLTNQIHRVFFVNKYRNVVNNELKAFT